MARELRALFFDFDGVIVDSIQLKTEAFRLLFQDYPEHIVKSVADYHRLHGGISRVDKIIHAHTHFLGTPLTKEEVKEWSRRYSELVVKKVIDVSWIAGAKEFLQKAKKNGFKIFVISGTPEDELKYILQKRGIADLFQEQLGSPVRKPQHIRWLLEKYQLNPVDCVFIGDALTDYDAAGETGLAFIGIQGEVKFPENTTVLPDCTGLQAALDDIFF
jgi:HAD superfamily hydrolase (TIGR01549 family)